MGKVLKIKPACNGCNAYKHRKFWCPKTQSFKKEPCPFSNRRDCDNYQRMCGEL